MTDCICKTYGDSNSKCESKIHKCTCYGENEKLHCRASSNHNWWCLDNECDELCKINNEVKCYNMVAHRSAYARKHGFSSYDMCIYPFN